MENRRIVWPEANIRRIASWEQPYVLPSAGERAGGRRSRRGKNLPPAGTFSGDHRGRDTAPVWKISRSTVPQQAVEAQSRWIHLRSCQPTVAVTSRAATILSASVTIHASLLRGMGASGNMCVLMAAYWR